MYIQGIWKATTKLYQIHSHISINKKPPIENFTRKDYMIYAQPNSHRECHVKPAHSDEHWGVNKLFDKLGFFLIKK